MDEWWKRALLGIIDWKVTMKSPEEQLNDTIEVDDYGIAAAQLGLDDVLKKVDDDKST